MCCFCCSITKSCLTICNPMEMSIPGFSVLNYFPDLCKFLSIESVILSSHLPLCFSFLFLLHSFPASGPFPMCQLSASGGQSTGAFFMVQILHLYLTTGKTDALTIQTFVSKIMSLLFNILSRFFIAIFPRSKKSFNFVATVNIHSDFGAQENKICHCFHFIPICHKVMGPVDTIFVCFCFVLFLS